MEGDVFILTLFSTLIFVGALILWAAMVNRRKLREMQYRERIALIERGLIPPPEIDPLEFETKAGIAPEPPPGAARFRSAGVITIGFGLALMMLLSFAARVPDLGIGIGGAFVLLGAAFLLNGFLLDRRDPYRPPLIRPGRPAPTNRPEPPNFSQ